MKTEKAIWQLSNGKIKELKLTEQFINHKIDSLEARKEKLFEQRTQIKEKILAEQRVLFRKGRTPKFKKGDILFRGMSDSYYSGRVRLTTDGELDDGGEFHYECEYVNKDGTLAKKQPTSGVWEHQLKEVVEENRKEKKAALEKMKIETKKKIEKFFEKDKKDKYGGWAKPTRYFVTDVATGVPKKIVLDCLKELESEGKVLRRETGSYRYGRTKWTFYREF